MEDLEAKQAKQGRKEGKEERKERNTNTLGRPIGEPTGLTRLMWGLLMFESFKFLSFKDFLRRDGTHNGSFQKKRGGTKIRSSCRTRNRN